MSALLCICCSCDLEEFEPHTPSKVTIEFIARPADYSNLDVTTKSEPTDDFETAIYTAYLLLFDASGNRIYFSDVDPESRLQRVTLKGLSTVTACFIANVNKADVEGITTIDGLNSAVLDIKYASYSEAYNHLGVPKLTVSGTSYPCFPMIGIKSMDVSQMTNIEIPLTRLFAKISVNIKMQLTNNQVGYISPTLVNYELDQYQLHNLPTKVSLIKNDDNDSAWKNDPDAFTGKSDLDPVSSPNYLGWQTININDNDNNASNNSGNVAGIGFYLYVPEYYLSPKAATTDNQKSKPVNYDSSNYAIYLELIGEVNQGLIDNTGIRHRIYLGGDNTKDFTLKRNVNYINQITITGITKNDTGTGEDLDHRVSSEIINNPVAQAGKAANCYIIAEPGEYTIPAYKGAYNDLENATLCMAGKDLSEYDTRVYILANMVEYEGLTSITFSKDPVYDAETNTISFTVNPMLTNDWVPNGNVIMALQYKRKGEDTEWITEWSWHLWFVFNITASADGWGTIGSQEMPDGTTKMMDRNLGVNALTNAATKIGFYYKYGEHTPYLDTDGDGTYTQCGGGSIDGSSTWNTPGKSVTDPCPPGYRVPASTVWSGDATKEHVGTPYNAFLYWNGGTTGVQTSDDIYYPYSGYIDASGKIQSQGYGVRDTTYNQAIDIPNPQTGLSTANALNYTDGILVLDPNNKTGPVKFTNLNYSKYNIHNLGILSAQDEELRYSFIEKGIDIISCTVQVGSWKRSGSLFSGYKYNAEYKNAAVTLTGDELKSKYPNAYNRLISVLNDDSGSNFDIALDIIENLTIPPQTEANTKPITSTSYGYQVRCVKE